MAMDENLFVNVSPVFVTLCLRVYSIFKKITNFADMTSGNLYIKI